MSVIEPTLTADAPPAAADEAAASAPAKRRRLRVDRSTVGLGVLVALAGGGLWHMHVRTAPSLAAAQKQSAAEAKVKAFLSAGQADIAKLQTSMEQTRRVVEEFAAAGPTTTVAAATAGPVVDPFEFESGTAKPQAADAAGMTREELRQRGAEAARKLRVGSVMFGGPRPACLINGKLVVEGGAVDEFTVERITQRSVLLRSGEFRYELQLLRK